MNAGNAGNTKNHVPRKLPAPASAGNAGNAAGGYRGSRTRTQPVVGCPPGSPPMSPFRRSVAALPKLRPPSASDADKPRTKKRLPRAASPIAALLELHMRAHKLPAPQPEYRFLEERRFRFDYAWPRLGLAVEVDGEVHRIKSRFHADIEKHALALLAGWTILRVGGREVRSGVAVQWIGKMIAALEAGVA